MPNKNEKSLKTKVENFPEKPGIYFFKDRKDHVIYIGKARSLRDRVNSYFLSTVDSKVHNILSETADIEFILVDSEREAAFLENNFIQQHQPKFNLRLKDDKSFPYLKLTVQEKYPKVYLTRKVEPDKARYFGPFSPAHQAKKTIHLLNRYFGLRSCREEIPGRRKRPCLEYELNLCSAPCVGYISLPEYKERVNNALLFLEGKVEKLLNIITQKMREAAENEEFELAAQWRDLIYTIEQIKEKPKLTSVQQENKDIFGFSQTQEQAAVYVFTMRKGKVRESENIIIPHIGKTPPEELMYSSLRKYYQEHSIPDKILLSFYPSPKEKLTRFLSRRKGKKIEMNVPVRGKNKRLLELAESNAKAVLLHQSEQLSSLVELKNILSLENVPRRIEGFDVSNIGGQESVASLVVFENGIPIKNDYRKYKIKTVKGPHDVASLYEVIQRRYRRLVQENRPFPDLMVVDGGKPQLGAAQKALHDMKLKGPLIIALAKKEETLYTLSHKKGISLERTSPGLKLIQMVRDEAHRFALTFHRKKRDKKSFASPLDRIPGIGDKRKQALLSRYKSLEEIKKASMEELAKTVGKKAAQELKKILVD